MPRALLGLLGSVLSPSILVTLVALFNLTLLLESDAP